MKNSFYLLLLLFFIGACKQAAPTVDESHIQGNYHKNAQKWPGNKAYVCWLTEENPTARSVANKAVVREFNGRTNIKYLGWSDGKESTVWGLCKNTPWDRQNIKIEMITGDFVGWSFAGSTGVIEHVFHSLYKNGATMQLSNCSKYANNVSFCIEGVALHEFGHATGLAHEQDRKDSPCKSGQEKQATRAMQALGTFDTKSIMNVCATSENFYAFPPKQFRLSAGDIKTIEFLYGKFDPKKR